MTVSASGCVPMRRSTRYVVVLACTAAVAVAVEVPALSLHIINAEGAVTSASRPGGRSPGGAADAVGRREETAVVDFRQVESDATAWLLGTVKNGNWNSRPMRNHRLDTIRHGTKGLVIPAVWIDS
jgi:hypothetical protein